MIGRAAELVSRLPDRPCVGAEIGIFAGRMSADLLSVPGLTLYMVDNWLAMPKYDVSQAQQSINYGIASRIAAESGGHILKMNSEDAALLIEDESLDFVFIDADHSYDGVWSDIEAWLPKIRPGGLLSGHDYNNPEDVCGPEVKRAVDEAAALHSWEVSLGADYTWFVTV